MKNVRSLRDEKYNDYFCKCKLSFFVWKSEPRIGQPTQILVMKKSCIQND